MASRENNSESKLGSELLLKFIEKTGSEYEYRLFKQLYAGVPKLKFAVIKISGESLEKSADEIAESLAYMSIAGIIPVVVHGAGSVLDRKLKASRRINGVRFTAKKDIPAIERTMLSLGKLLERKIKASGGKAILLAEKIFYCSLDSKHGWVGRVRKVELSQIEKAVESGCIPIISPLGVLLKAGKPSSQVLNINADTAAKELVKRINPKKLIFVTETGGVLDSAGKVIPFLNLHSRTLLKNVSGGMLHKVMEIRDFLHSNEDCAVTITSAENLLKEIFTIKGSGTYIKYHSLKYSPGFSKIDQSRLRSLINDAFCGRHLSKTYFNSEAIGVIYEKNYDGAAVIKKVKGIPYLDKFVVAKTHQGTGLGQSLWYKVVRNYPKLIWRAKKDNPINSFYLKNCDGMMKRQRWNVYWLSLDDKEIIPMVKAVLKKEKTIY